ncbi:MAG: type II toxin-antitoxin system RelE/ParE family toxin [Oscillospiraceae bacterium]|nr:type II toxin-antitoxin system RelE/ParE family toxin [Oscillospiraceae bacterium]
MKRFEVIFYEDARGNCPIADWIRKLDHDNGKDSQSMLRKLYFQIERLENEGPDIGEPIVKRISKDIWELRPIPNRIFF